MAPARTRSASQSSRSRRPPLRRASQKLAASEREGPKVRLPLIGLFTLPPPEHLTWYLAIGAMAAVELVDWPVALIIATGKVLADNRHSNTLRNIGDAMENAA